MASAKSSSSDGGGDGKTKKIDPDSLPVWKSDLKLVEAFNDMQFSLLDGAISRVEPDRKNFEPSWNAKETLSIIATNAERTDKTGKKLDYLHIIQTSDQSEAIVLKVMEARKLAEDVPLLIVQYWHSVIGKPENAEIMQSLLSHPDGESMKNAVYAIKAERGEVPFLRDFLQKNEKRLDADFRKRRNPNLSRGFRTSFITPIKGGPKPSEEAKAAWQCVVCGKPKKYQCSRCRLVSYCSKECQGKHWSSHKPDCQKLSDTPFILADARKVPEEMSGGITLSWIQPGFNRLKNQQPFDMTLNGEGFSVGQVFTVKVQVPICGTQRGRLGQSMLLYDKNKKIQTHLWPGNLGDAMASYELLDKHIRTRGDMGVRAFMLAEHLGEGRLKLFYSRLLPHPGW